MKKKMIALTCSLIFANTIPVFAASDYGINIDQKYVSGDASQLSDAISESLNDMGVKKVSSYDLEKKEDSLDRRVWRVYPTLKGQEVYRYISHEEEKSSEIYYKDFSKKEKEDLFILLEKMKKNIEGTWNEIKKPKSSKK